MPLEEQFLTPLAEAACHGRRELKQIPSVNKLGGSEHKCGIVRLGVVVIIVA